MMTASAAAAVLHRPDRQALLRALQVFLMTKKQRAWGPRWHCILAVHCRNRAVLLRAHVCMHAAGSMQQRMI